MGVGVVGVVVILVNVIVRGCTTAAACWTSADEEVAGLEF